MRKVQNSRRRLARLLTLVCIALFGGGATSYAAVVPESRTIDHQRTLIAPATHADGRVVLFVHGAGEDGDSLFIDPLQAATVATLHAHGYVLASADAGGTAWGTNSSLQAYVDTIAYLRRQGLTRLYILCQSMGGLDAARLAGMVGVEAWAGIYPLTNLASIVATSRPGIEATLGPYFGYYWKLLSPVHATFPQGLPMLFWSSFADRVVPREENTEITANEAKADGAKVTVVTTVGEHGDPSNFQSERLLNFFDHARVRGRHASRRRVESNRDIIPVMAPSVERRK